MKAARSFIPDLMPPKLDYASFFSELGMARGKLGEFNGALRSLKNPQLISAPLITKEAVFSSQIEGTQATLEDVYRIEALGGETQDTELEMDVREISNYRVAVQEAVSKLAKLPISTRLIQSLHVTLLDSVRGANRDRGSFRKIQVFIGPKGATIEKATFVPPPANEIPDLMGNWEKYVNGEQEVDPLIVAGVAHYQFEAIHPFLDGNGRIGRILIPLILYDRKILRYPSFFISQYFEEHRQEYYRSLNSVSSKGDFTQWLKFFLNGIAQTSSRAIDMVERIHDLYDELMPISLKASIQQGKTILDVLFDSPLISFKKIKALLPELNSQTVYNVLSRLEDEGVLTEITGFKRNRVYRLDRLIEIVS